MANFVRAGVPHEYIGLSTDTKPTTSEDTTGTLAEALDDSETGVDVSDGTLFDADTVILVDSEQMRIVSIATNTLTVVRGVTGTSAAAHNNGSAIYRTRDIPVGSRCFETNTGDWYITADGSTWVLDKRVT